MSELKVPEVNRVLVSGRLTRDPEQRWAADGTAVTGFTLAFHRHYRARDGRVTEHTGFVPVASYGRLAEVCGQALHKGSPVLVEGRLQMREWATREGRRQTRLEIRAEQVHFLEKAEGAPEAANVPLDVDAEDAS
jgi:single-strand DNA-binding protein